MSINEKTGPQMPFFVHFRRMAPDGNGGRRQVSRYAATVCIAPREGGSGSEYHAGVALCSPRDHFCRRTGRLISAGRARDGGFPGAVLLELEGAEQGLTIDDWYEVAADCVAWWTDRMFRPDESQSICSDLFGEDEF